MTEQAVISPLGHTVNSGVALANGRILGLDRLRALAVFLVLGHHAAFRFPPAPDDFLAQVFRQAGWMGVDIFFVISGYMITRVLLRDLERQDVKGFFIRRAFRILPLLLAAVGLFVVVAVITGREAEKLTMMWSPALLLNGWTIPFIGYGKVPNTITWSLSVEETAYALLGMASVAGLGGIRRMLVALLLLAVGVRLLVLATGVLDLADLYYFVPARLDGIALGGLAALGAFDGLARHRHMLWLFTCLTLGLIWYYQYTEVSSWFMALVGYQLFALACTGWVAGLVRAPSPPGRSGSTLVNRAGELVAGFGQVSYFVYLFHMFVLEGLRVLVVTHLLPPLTFWQAVLATVVLTYVAASFSWRQFEEPLIQKGRYLSCASSAPA